MTGIPFQAVDVNGNNLYPVTHESAIKFDDGESLQSKVARVATIEGLAQTATDKATEAAGSASTANADREIIEGVKGEVLAVLESEEDRELAEEDRNTSEIERKEAEIQRELAKAQTLADLEGEYAPALNAVTGQLAAIAQQTDNAIATMGMIKTFKGTCLFAALPTTGMVNGDYWYVSDQATNYCFNGTAWVNIGNDLKLADGSVKLNHVNGVTYSYRENIFNKYGRLDEKPSSGTFYETTYDVANNLIITQGQHGVELGKGQKIAVEKNTPYTIHASSVGQNHTISIYTESNVLVKIFTVSADTDYKTTFNSGDNDFVYILFATWSKTGIYGLRNIHFEKGADITNVEDYPAIKKIFYMNIEDMDLRNQLGIEQGIFNPLVGEQGKNLFIKNNSVPGYLNSTSGADASGAGYFRSEYIKVLPSTEYTINPGQAEVLIEYDTNKQFIRKIDSYSPFITSLNAGFIRISAADGKKDTVQIELGAINTIYETGNKTYIKLADIRNKSIPNSKLESISFRDRIYDLKDAWIAWENGQKFPVAFAGDSTTDGANTSVYNTNNNHSAMDALAGGIGEADYVNTKAYPYLLEQLIRKETGSSVARIYNIGYSGSTVGASDTLLDEYLGYAYADTKMFGISYGINDRVNQANTSIYETNFKQKLESLINKLFTKGVQPFLLTTQATIEPFAHDAFVATSPLRTSEAINSVANRVKKEMANKYNLELIDINEFTELFLTYSQIPANLICQDTLHFDDRGHQAEAEFIFSKFCPRVIEVKDDTILGFTSQKLKSKIPSNKITILSSIDNGFKVKAEYVKDNANDILIQDFWIMNLSKTQFNLKSYVKAIEAAYTKLSDTVINLSSLEQILSSSLDIGLHHIEAFTGTSINVNFIGFKLTKV